LKDALLSRGTTLQVAAKLVALKGHGFSRAATDARIQGALAPEGMLLIGICLFGSVIRDSLKDNSGRNSLHHFGALGLGQKHAGKRTAQAGERRRVRHLVDNAAAPWL
jgi:hypothetical protein